MASPPKSPEGAPISEAASAPATIGPGPTTTSSHLATAATIAVANATSAAPASRIPALPDFIPAMLTLKNPLDAASQKLLEDTYKGDFVKGMGLQIEGKEVWWNQNPAKDPLPGMPCEGCLHHLITKGPFYDRKYDSERAQRLPWALPILRNHGNTVHLKKWYYLEGDETKNLYVWLKNHDYIVVLQNRTLPIRGAPLGTTKEVLFLLSAYHVDGPNSRQDFEEKYKNRMR